MTARKCRIKIITIGGRWGSLRVVGKEKANWFIFHFFNFIIIILTAPIFHGEYKFSMAYIKTRAIVMTTISAQSCIVPL